MSRPLRWGTLPIAVVLGISLVACSGTGSDTAAALEESPITQLFKDVKALGNMSQEEEARARQERDRKIEELISQCMAEQGFDYKPLTPAPAPSAPDAAASTLGELDYAKQYGYGLTTWTETEDAQPAQVDPNEATYEGMSEAERAAWDRALWGEGDTASGQAQAGADSGEGADLDGFTMAGASGCSATAQQQVEQSDGTSAATDAVFQDPQNAELMTRLAKVYADLDSDPAMISLNQKWAECMAEAGYSYRKPQEALEAIFNARSGGTAEAADSEQDGDLDALRKREIDTATADYTCRDEIGYATQERSAKYAAEQAFIDENRPQIDAMIAALNEAST